MAKLSAHGTEIARFEKTDDDFIDGQSTRRTVSVRSDRTILMKVDVREDGRRYPGTWKLRHRHVNLEDVLTAFAQSEYRRIR